ncbi:MAG TPA: glycosyltransferase [Thermoanaerobaculia bacterium]|nr:glycosyltransferase [Thermoanaerobaculia bacterium]
MRIVQIVLPAVTAFEEKCRRVDHSTLSTRHEVLVAGPKEPLPAADVAHVYGPGELPAAAFIGFRLPYVASSEPVGRAWVRKPARPAYVLSPLESPEPVEEVFFQLESRIPSPESHVLGSFARSSIANLIEQTLGRIRRFRDDVEWRLFERAPTPEDLAGVDAWVDPATAEDDLDGFVAEALVSGKPVVASRITINLQRLEKGRTGFLVPPGDPNELTHAILTALFKPEVARTKIEAARQTAGKFRPRQRLRLLERIYETVMKPSS